MNKTIISNDSSTSSTNTPTIFNIVYFLFINKVFIFQFGDCRKIVDTTLIPSHRVRCTYHTQMILLSLYRCTHEPRQPLQMDQLPLDMKWADDADIGEEKEKSNQIRLSYSTLAHHFYSDPLKGTLRTY